MSADVVKTAEEVDANIKAIIARTGYSHEVTSGQRKYGGPPPSWDGTPPGPGHEVFCGKIPKDVLEDELIPLFEDCGTIWDLRLMMDPASGTNRSFCFVTFTDKAAVEKAVKQLDGYQIRPGKKLKVNPSTPNSRLFVGNIPKSKSKDDIMNEFSKVVENITEVIIYNVPDDPKKKNRGFTFLDFDSHKSAANAKKRLSSCRVFGCDIIVDWADPLEEPSEETMSKVKVLYVRNLKSDVSEQLLRSVFEVHGAVEKVKKVKDYGFVHFAERDDALRALEALNGTKVNDSEMMVSLAKPPTDAKLKEKRKLQHMLLLGRAGFDQYGWGAGPMVAMRGMPRGGRMRLQPPMRGNYRYAGGPRFTDYYPANYDSYGGYMYQDDYSANYSGGYEDYGASYDDSYVDYYSSGPYNMNQSGPALRGRGRGGGNYQGLAGGRGAGPTSFQPQFASRGWARGGRGQRVFGATATRGGFKRGKPGLEVGGMGDGKKSMDGWCSQPIAQQPLGQTMSGGFEGCGGDSSGAEWYNDSYPPQSAMATHAW